MLLRSNKPRVGLDGRLRGSRARRGGRARHRDEGAAQKVWQHRGLEEGAHQKVGGRNSRDGAEGDQGASGTYYIGLYSEGLCIEPKRDSQRLPSSNFTHTVSNLESLAQRVTNS